MKRHIVLAVGISVLALSLPRCDNNIERQATQPHKSVPSSRASTTPTVNRPSLGEEGILHNGTSDPNIMVATTKSALDELTKACTRNDKYGVAEMFLAGKVFGPAQGVKVLVLDASGFVGSTRQIRILEGEYKGRKGWVPYEFVKSR